MIKKTQVCAMGVALLIGGVSQSQAGMLNDAKQVLVNSTFSQKAKAILEEEPSDFEFARIYNKAFYKTKYFGLTVTGAAIVAGGAFTYFTAGAGAPVAATGVSSVASAVAGGGAGSYMAGLSIVGGWFGGNAILGASILNGISIGLIGGGTTSFAAMSAAAKFGVMASVTASALDGVFILSNPDTGAIEYRVRLSIPKDIGGETTQYLVNNIYDTEESLRKPDKESGMEMALSRALAEKYQTAITHLEAQLDETPVIEEDLVVLSAIAWNQNNFDLFSRAITKLNTAKAANGGFLFYLRALQSLYSGDAKKAQLFLDQSITANNYAIEPILLKINLLGFNNFKTNLPEISKLVAHAEEHFDMDKYSTDYSLVPLYYRIANFYFQNNDYSMAKVFFEKANDKLSFFASDQTEHIIELGVANSLYRLNDEKGADMIVGKIISDDDIPDSLRNNIKQQYLGFNR